MPREYLPVFNSNVIDLYIPRIEGLSERYLYACDDYIVMREQKPEDYFSEKAAHCDILCKFAVREDISQVLQNVLMEHEKCLPYGNDLRHTIIYIYEE